MNLEEYKEERVRYEELAKNVRDILHAVILNSECKYHVHQIQYRAKTYDSLKKRLLEENKENSENIEEIRNDLAGCRIIFYYNGDVDVFMDSDLIKENFKIIKIKIHGPKNEIITANDLYTANHFIIELNDNRASLPEYARFKGLKCEIQVHTVLTHAWSETSHDITYKKQEITNFGTNLLKGIDSRLQKIMKDYLIPAGYDFQKIQYDHQRLLNGEILYDCNMVQKIIECQDNNERFDILERFREDVLPLYDPEYFNKNFNSIIEIIKTAIFSARDVDRVDIDTPVGSIKGKTFNDVFEKCLNILNFIQYFNVKLVFSYLIKLYLEFIDKQNRDSIEKAVINLVKYNLSILKQVDFFIQDIILRGLEDLDDDTLNQTKSIVAVVGREILCPNIEGTLSNYKTFTWMIGNIPDNDIMEKIRHRMITLLQRVYGSQNSNIEKINIISALTTATSTPNMNNYSDKLLLLILLNSIEIIDFYTSLIPVENYEILRKLEEKVCFLYERSKDSIEENGVKNIDYLEQSNVLINKALKFKNKLNKGKEFVIYKTLVGYESVFEPSWDNPEWKVRGENEYREKKVNEYVVDVVDKNVDFWEKMILECMQTQSDDRLTFPYLAKFLNLLGERKPDFIFSFLSRHEEVLSVFFNDIVNGLLRSTAHEKITLQMNQWAEEGKYLWMIAGIFDNYQPFNEPLLKKVFNKAKANSDTYAFIKIISAVTKNFDTDRQHLMNELFLPAIRELTILGSTEWIFNFWRPVERNKVIAALDEEGIDIVLQNLLLRREIDFHIEEILMPITQQYPQKILEFFKFRLGSLINTFDAIPFKFHCLNKVLSAFPELVIETVSGWYDSDYHSFINGGAKLIYNIFPDYPDNLSTKLTELVKTNQENDLLIVMAILRNYNGNSKINPVCKEIVKILPIDSELLSEILVILENIGMVEGYFGLVEAYTQKKHEISEWLKDSDIKVKASALKFIRDLENKIILENRRVNELIELDKHRFGDETDNS